MSCASYAVSMRKSMPEPVTGASGWRSSMSKYEEELRTHFEAIRQHCLTTDCYELEEDDAGTWITWKCPAWSYDDDITYGRCEIPISDTPDTWRF